MLLEKELEIRKFEPQPYWQLELIIKLDGQEYIANYEEARIWDKKIADDVVSGSKGKDAVVKDIKKKEYRQLPPVPFNTTDLQSDCYAHFKFSPTQTMGIAERLYQAGFISYPRSSSQKLPPSIGYKKILESLAKLKPYEKLAKQLLAKAQLLPNEGQRTDPAHPAVYPTAETADLNNLSPQQRKIYDLIIRRFLAVFADAAIRETMNVILDVGGNKFILVGKRTIESGWIDYYKPYATFEEQILPEIKIDQKIKVLKLDELAKETQPPGRFSQGSILKEMEKRELGTRATRAEILQTLYDRRYIIGKSIMVTKLGEVVTKVLKEFSPEVISEQLTRKFEEDMELVYEGKKKRETIVKEAEKFLVGVLKEFKKNENKIGKKLLEGLVDARKEERKLGSCPKCGNELRIIRSRRTGLFFVGCGGYPNCKNGYPLPHNARIDKTGRICEKCNTPIVRIIRAGKRPFNMCLDPKCETKKDWGKPKKTKDKNKVESKDKEVATEKKIEETKEIKKPSK
jgi:DNA topoisomerase-1